MTLSLIPFPSAFPTILQSLSGIKDPPTRQTLFELMTSISQALQTISSLENQNEALIQRAVNNSSISNNLMVYAGNDTTGTVLSLTTSALSAPCPGIYLGFGFSNSQGGTFVGNPGVTFDLQGTPFNYLSIQSYLNMTTAIGLYQGVFGDSAGLRYSVTTSPSCYISSLATLLYIPMAVS
ncbi:MAG: hypothetical protein ACRDF4_03405 [Rhabdochlamydiaceae bacterium]